MRLSLVAWQILALWSGDIKSEDGPRRLLLCCHHLDNKHSPAIPLYHQATTLVLTELLTCRRPNRMALVSVNMNANSHANIVPAPSHLLRAGKRRRHAMPA